MPTVFKNSFLCIVPFSSPLKIFPISFFSLTCTCLSSYHLQLLPACLSSSISFPSSLTSILFLLNYSLFTPSTFFCNLFSFLFFRGGRVWAIWGQSTKKKTFNLSSPESNWKSSRNDSIWIVFYIEVYVKVKNPHWNFSCLKQENENASLSHVFAFNVILTYLLWGIQIVYYKFLIKLFQVWYMFDCVKYSPFPGIECLKISALFLLFLQ